MKSLTTFLLSILWINSICSQENSITIKNHFEKCIKISINDTRDFSF